MKAYEGVWGEWKFKSISNLGTTWMWVISVIPRPLYPLRKTLSTHCTGNWVGPSVGPDVSEKRKVYFPPRDQKSERCSLQLSDYNDPQGCSVWDGVYFSGEISGWTSIIREASSAKVDVSTANDGKTQWVRRWYKQYLFLLHCCQGGWIYARYNDVLRLQLRSSLCLPAVHRSNCTWTMKTA